jgi:5-amino-6-(5-phosphoribosylamino)uracil reductase
MAEHPYTVLSCGMSIDGYLDGATTERLSMSNDADFDRVDGVRATCDAILVGAATVRNDNPRLLVRSPSRRGERVARGVCGSPMKVTVTEHGKLDPYADFFAAGDAEKLVYCATPAVDETRDRLGSVATVVDAGQPVEMGHLSENLYDRGVRRLLVEGGGTIHTQFLTADLADELHLVVAPFFVGDLVLLRYALSSRFGPDRLGEA